MQNDLISRVALLDAMPKKDELFSYDVRRVVCDAPTIDAVEVVHGRWDYRPYRADTHITASGEVVCSNCHAAYFRVRGHWFKFCPHCGAKMGGARATLDGGAEDD